MEGSPRRRRQLLVALEAKPEHEQRYLRSSGSKGHSPQRQNTPFAGSNNQEAFNEAKKLRDQRQNTQKYPSSNASRLEEKLEDLVSLLRAGIRLPTGAPTGPPRGPTTVATATTALPTQGGQPQDIISNVVSPTDSDIEHNGANYVPPNAIALTPSATATDVSSSSSAVASFPLTAFEPTLLQTEQYLTLFYSELLPYFPCIYIPPGASAQQFRRHRPFTWLCIMDNPARRVLYIRPISDRNIDL
ncbi:uncharacterized protein ATNIH1004_011438 [Aspergillus tanneri]|uniref:Uncharacterized protein n=1 Tax=Aspergillus tanneri TaxID=1220188 RepID=A0A5M9MC19_9EURO|nr:uncharacterized protein ATNIH1004_011438 [Aspergillus tanneri]KAA8642493.1 hypothetical protein ATNIH1004_011438 [Aspergillus tanneri]